MHKGNHYIWYKQLLVSIIFLLLTLSSYSQIILLSSNQQTSNLLNSSLELAEVPPSWQQNKNIENIPFRPLKSWIDFHSDKDYIGKISLINHSSKADWVLEFPQVYTQIETYQVLDNALTFIGRTGTFLPPKQRTYAPILKPNLIKLNIPKNSKQTYFIHFSCQRIGGPLTFQLQLTEEETFRNQILNNKTNNWFYTGLTLMLLIISLVLFAYVKVWSYIFYSIYLLGIIIFTNYNAGVLADLIIPTFINEHPQFIYLSKLVIYPALAGYMSFIRNFLELDKVFPLWSKWFKLWTIAAIPLGLIELYLLLTSNFSFQSDVLNMLYASIFILSTFIFIIPLYKLRADRKALYILLGSIFMCIGLFITVLLRIQSVTFTFNYFKIGSILEFILFTIGLAFGQQKIIKEKQQAAFELERNQLVQQREKELQGFKTRFYDNITHEFRTPITVIRGLAQLDNWTDKDRRIIIKNADQLLEFVNQLLDLSKLESKEYILRLQQVDIIPLIKQWIYAYKPLADTKQQILSIETNLDHLYLDTDSQALEKIISNLVGNAIKYTPNEGSITIKMEQANDQLLIAIKDTGSGIPENLLSSIFDRYYQIDSQELYHGNGIGLSMVKELTELLEGTITVNSTKNYGTTFSLQFPIRKGHPISDSNKTIETKLKTSISLPDSKPIVATENDSLKPTLLIIEDNQDLIFYMDQLLSNQFHLEKALDGVSGLEKAKEIIPHIIICDVMMPKMDGFQVCAQLKTNPSTDHIPIIMLTAKSAQEDRIEGFRSGVDAFLNKSFFEAELMIHIQRLQNRQQRMQQWIEQLPKEDKRVEIAFLQEQVFLQENTFLQAINTYLEDHKYESFTIKELAFSCHLGERQFGRKLKFITGFNPSKYIRFYKSFKAKEILITNELQIKEIAYQVGFQNVAVFNKAFKEFYDTTPTDLREILKNSKES